MKPYGRRNKTHTHVAGHQRCAVCHPPDDVEKARARRENRDETARQQGEVEYGCDVWCAFCAGLEGEALP